jgi:hypothetical protein
MQAMTAAMREVTRSMPCFCLCFDWRAPFAAGVEKNFLGTGVTVAAFGPLRVSVWQED